CNTKIPVIYLAALLVAAVSVTHSDNSRAGCTCICVDGLNRPLCASLEERKPLCPPRVCPREPSQTRPLDQPGIPPTGATPCSREYIYNRYAQRYEWWQVCQ
ncbi:MAG TPA: hypothetical protein VMZ32_07055, partial [Gammaproteobacteria bacterium]|nr:hypothetical protein [Gammaproteobacteria bacterium]